MKTVGVISSFAFALVIASAGTDSAPEPFFEGLGSHTRKISTVSSEAQKYFDQGFDFLFGFNHGAAIRAFQAAEIVDCFARAPIVQASDSLGGRKRSSPLRRINHNSTSDESA